MTRSTTTTFGLLLALGAIGGVRSQSPGARAQAQATAMLRAVALEQDDVAAAAADVLGAIEQDPASPLGELLAGALGELLREQHPPAPMRERMRALIQHRELHGLTEWRLRQMLAQEERALGRSAEADALDPTTQNATHFMVAGPFGDGGSFFHGVPYAPEEGVLDPGAQMEGRYAKVGWRKAVRSPGQPWIKPERRGPRQDGCHYVLHQVDAPTARTAWLSLAGGGSFEVFVNGRKALDVNRVAERLPSRFMLAARLAQGRNHVLLKTTSPWASSLSLRYCDARGRTLTELVEEREARIVGIAPRPAADEGAPPAFVDAPALLTKLIDEAAEPVLTAAAGLARIWDGMPSEGLEQLGAAHAAAPEDPVVAMALVQGLAKASHLPQDLARTRRRAIIEQVAAAHPGHTAARLMMARLLVEDDRKEDALKSLLAAVEKSGTGGLETRKTLIDVYQSLSWEAEQRRTLDEALKLFPSDPDLISRRIKDRREDGDLAGILVELSKLLEGRPGDARLLNQQKDVLVRLGRFEEAAASLLAARRTDDAYETQMALAEIFERDPRFHERARKALSAASEKEPEAPEPLIRLGDLCLEAGDEQAAAGFLKRALEQDPSQHPLRRRLARLSGDRELSELEPFRMDGMALAKAFKPRPGDEDSVSTLVLDQMIIRVYEDGSCVEETHQVRRINDREGVEAHEEAAQAAAADELLLLRTIAPDGSTYVPNRVSDAFSMPRLEPGAFVEEQYREFKRSPGAGPWRLTNFFFRSRDEPFVLSQLVVLLPASVRGQFAVRNFDGGPKVVQMGDLTAHVFEKRDQPRVVEEDQAPELNEIVPWVTYGEHRSYNQIAREWNTTLQNRTRGSREVDRATARIVDSIANDTDRVQALHDFVNREIPDTGGAADPTSILLKKEGSRWLLFVAMVRSAGIPFRFGIFRPHSPETDPEPEPLFSGDAYFTRAGVLLEPRGGEPMWVLDGVPRFMPPGRPLVGMGIAMDGARGLLVTGSDAVPVTLPGVDPIEHALMRVESKVSLRDGGMAEMDVVVRFGGVAGYVLKERLKGINANVRKVIANQVAQQAFPGWTLRTTEFMDLEVDGKPLWLKGQLGNRRALETVGDSKALPLLMDKASLTENLGGKSERVYPFVLRNWVVMDLRLVVDPGDGFEVSRLPESVVVRRGLMDYGLSFWREGKTVVMQRRMFIRPGRIQVKDFGEWLRMCRAVDDAESQRFVLTER